MVSHVQEFRRVDRDFIFALAAFGILIAGAHCELLVSGHPITVPDLENTEFGI